MSDNLVTPNSIQAEIRSSEGDLGSDSGVTDAEIEAWADTLGLGSKAVLTTKETAVVLRLSERHVRDQIKDGTIPCIRFGRRVLVPVPMLLKSLLREPGEQMSSE